MLAGGTDVLYRDVLAGSHRQVCRLEVWRDHQRIDLFGDQFDEEGYSGVPHLGGNVNATLRSRITRNLNLTVHESLVPYLDDEDGLLTPYGNYLRVVRGVELGNGIQYTWPVFYGQIATTNDTGDGTIEIDAADRAQLVDDAKFGAPRASSVGVPVRQQVRELIEEADPAAEFDIATDVAGLPVPELTWEYDRARGLDELSTSAGCLWWVLPGGTYTLRPVPWANFAPPVVTLRERVDRTKLEQGAIVHRARGSISNRTVVNDVVGYGERLDGTTPVWGRATNNNPDSPTRANGPIGRRTRLVRLQTPQNDGTIQGAVEDYLRRGAGLAEEWSWAQTPDAAMELGDPVALAPVRRRVPVVQVVSSYTMPLDINAQMNVSGRAMVINAGDEDL